MPIRNYAGVILFAGGAWMLNSALQRRKRALTAWRAARAAGTTIDVGTSPKFAITGAITRPITYLLLALAGAEVALSYPAVGSRLFSYIDLGGFLFVLLAYAVWFSISTRYRDVTGLQVAPVTVAREQG